MRPSFAKISRRGAHSLTHVLYGLQPHFAVINEETPSVLLHNGIDAENFRLFHAASRRTRDHD
jgi:hypothetical protein